MLCLIRSLQISTHLSFRSRRANTRTNLIGSIHPSMHLDRSILHGPVPAVRPSRYFESREACVLQSAFEMAGSLSHWRFQVHILLHSLAAWNFRAGPTAI